MYLDRYYLKCINLELDNQQPFYFAILPNGREIGQGYNVDVYEEEYVLNKEYFNNFNSVNTREIHSIPVDVISVR